MENPVRDGGGKGKCIRQKITPMGTHFIICLLLNKRTFYWIFSFPRVCACDFSPFFSFYFFFSVCPICWYITSATDSFELFFFLLPKMSVIKCKTDSPLDDSRKIHRNNDAFDTSRYARNESSHIRLNLKLDPMSRKY